MGPAHARSSLPATPDLIKPCPKILLAAVLLGVLLHKKEALQLKPHASFPLPLALTSHTNMGNPPVKLSCLDASLPLQKLPAAQPHSGHTGLQHL